MYGFTIQELKILRALKTPEKIQDFLETIPINFEKNGDTCMSPRRVLRAHTAHCLEGAMLAAAALWMQGEKPLLMDLKTVKSDDYHVVALFRKYDRWGAISKTNHAVLRYRDPIYRTLRELALSYFHEYYLQDGRKTLRSFSRPLDLSQKWLAGWTTDEKDVWYISNALEDHLHLSLLTRAMIAALRKSDPIEIKAGDLELWPEPKRHRSRSN